MNCVDGSNQTSSDLTLPWGVYVPPNTNGRHHGYVSIVERKGKSFPCGYTRSAVRSKRAVLGVKRSHDEISTDMHAPCENRDIGDTETTDEQHDITESKDAEECLHPEEAVFLCTRGLLRVESFPATCIISSEQRPNATMTTQELMMNMLPECNISLTAYLAYAHLREQGYIILRYTADRLGLLVQMNSPHQMVHDKTAISSEKSALAHDQDLSNDVAIDSNCASNNTGDGQGEVPIAQDHTDAGQAVVATNGGKKHLDKKKNTKQMFKDDVANAPPPCVCCNEFHSLNSSENDSTTLSLSYLAYNPNSKFRRTHPGLPDFGVAIMPFYSHGETEVTFETLSSLLSLCKLNRCRTENDIDLPLRVMAVSDGGAVIAFGVTGGDVPSINSR